MTVFFKVNENQICKAKKKIQIIWNYGDAAYVENYTGTLISWRLRSMILSNLTPRCGREVILTLGLPGIQRDMENRLEILAVQMERNRRNKPTSALPKKVERYLFRPN